MFHQRNRRLGKFIKKLRTINDTLQDRTDSDGELRSTNKSMNISTLEDEAIMMSRNVRHQSIISFMKSPKVLGHKL